MTKNTLCLYVKSILKSAQKVKLFSISFVKYILLCSVILCVISCIGKIQRTFQLRTFFILKSEVSGVIGLLGKGQYPRC